MHFKLTVIHTNVAQTIKHDHALSCIHTHSQKKNLEKAAGLLLLPKYNETPLTVLQWFWGLNYILVHCFSSMVNNQPAPGLRPLLSLSFLLSTFSPVCIQHILPGCLWSRTHPPHSTCWCPPQGLLWPSPPHPWKDLPKSLKKQQWVKMMCQYIHTPGTKVLFVLKCVFFCLVLSVFGSVNINKLSKLIDILNSFNKWLLQFPSGAHYESFLMLS